jgi:hypothetical protein
MEKKKFWIAEAIKNPNSLRKKASKVKGGMTKSGNISQEFLDTKSKGTTQKQKNLAKTLSKFSKRK